MNRELDIFELQAQLCQSIGQAVRLRIVHTLKEGPKAVNDIASSLSITQSTASRHLSILRTTGILTTQRRGSEVYYEIANPKVVEICEMMRALLAERESQFLDIISNLRE